MASSQTSNKLGTSLKINVYDHDPGATTAKLAGPDGGNTIRYADMRDLSRFMAIATPTTGTSTSVTKLEIVACADTAFSSVTVVKDSGTVAADALDDFVVQECTAEEIAALGDTLRYVAARVTQGGNADNEAKVIYIGVPRWAYDDLTTTTIS